MFSSVAKPSEAVAPYTTPSSGSSKAGLLHTYRRSTRYLKPSSGMAAPRKACTSAVPHTPTSHPLPSDSSPIATGTTGAQMAAPSRNVLSRSPRGSGFRSLA